MLNWASARSDTRAYQPVLRTRNVLAAVLVACTTVLSSCVSVTPTTATAPVKTMRVNGYDLAFVERGSGVPVVLVHGSLSDYRSWAAQMGPLGARYRVIALSLRHFYPERWDGKGDDFSIEQHARDVASFIEGLNAGRVHLIAHSRGGNVGLHVAKLHPELLRSLVLADASGLEVLLPKTQAGESDAASGAAARKKLQQRLLAGEVDRGLAEYADFTTGPGTWAASPEESRQVRRDNAWTIIGDVGRPQTTCAEGAKITMPTLLINGEVSPVRYRQMFDAFQECLKDRERVFIPKASHAMFRTHPDAINASVLKFLDRN
jgi:esterase